MSLIKQSDNGKKVLNIRGGAGEALIFASSLPEEGPLSLASRIELAPGASIGLHRHDTDEEVYAIASGLGIYSYDGGECEARAGDIFTTKRGMSHALRNTGSDPLIFFAVVAE